MNKKVAHIFITVCIGCCISNVTAQQNLPQLGKSPIEAVIKAMTLEEKVDLLVGQGMYAPGLALPGMPTKPSEAQKRVLGAAGTTVAIPRLGIPSIVVCDGPAGVHPLNMGKGRIYYATAWPTGTTLASSWDTALIHSVGTALGIEAREFGIDIVLGPGMNIHRNPLGARNFEYYSEDPVITGSMAAAAINGMQSAGVGVSAKHFFANNQETNRNTLNTIISERALREIYLKGWQYMLQHSSPWTIMSSYNFVNGPYTSENPELLRNILRKEWGFKGFVMTDWFGGKNAVAQQIAGNNLLMPGTPLQEKAITDAVKNGQLSETVLDENIAEILQIILKSPSFKNYDFSDNPPLKAHGLIARKAAAESMVLLKNDQQTLPILGNKHIALFGNNSVSLIAGGTGSGDVAKMYTVTLAEGLFNAGYTIDGALQKTYKEYMQAENAKRPKQSFFEEMSNPLPPIKEMEAADAMITNAANQNDLAIIAIGRNAGEGVDRKIQNDFKLTDIETNLIKRVAAAFHAKKKKVIVTLNIGGVIETAPWRNQVDAILLAWQPGQEGGNAMADIISGAVNPSGKLASTFPMNYEDDITAKNFPGREIPGSEKPGQFGQPVRDAEVIYEEGVYVGYRYYSSTHKKTAYPFGHGLSYTTFNYSNLKINHASNTDSIEIKVTVTNTGKKAGKEVAQLYVTAPAATLDKPMKELKAFSKTSFLQPGKSEVLTFHLTPADLASFYTSQSAWIADAGTYTLQFGNAEEDVIKGQFSLSKEIVTEKVTHQIVPKGPINEWKPPVKK